jgi:transposase
MAKSKNNDILSVVHPICCGLDVHKDEISACLVTIDEKQQVSSEIRDFGTFTHELVKLRDWLLGQGCPIVALESTGIYWRPVHNILENHLKVVLVNARHVKNVPGRKTDIGDSQWLAGLLRNGLLKGSFIPPKEVRQWRDLTRSRKKIVETVGDYKRRVQKLLESANIKIDSVASDLFGVTGRNLMNLLLSAPQEITLADVERCLRGRIRSKLVELHQSIQGFFTGHHRFLLATLLHIVDSLENEIHGIDQKLDEVMSAHEDLISRMIAAAGVERVSAQAILAEVGPTLEQFDNDAACCSWAGLCPGNNESAGKRKSGKSPVHKHHIKTIMTEVAWAAVKKKGSYYRSKYYRLKARLAAKRAIIAVAHRLFKALYFIIKKGATFKDLGETYLVEHNKASILRRISKQAKILGYQLVALEG